METIVQTLTDWGYWGLFLSALAAGSILPFSSEAMMAVLLGAGLNPLVCIAAATAGNTLGGMTCYWIGTLGRPEWIERLGITPQQIECAQRFLAGRGALMGFFAFLPAIGEAIAVVLGLMHGNPWLTALSMCLGKAVRYITVAAAFGGIASLF